MQVLTYGYKKPQTGDKGSVFFPALEFDITRLNDHYHNGADSALIPSQSLSLTTQTILVASWALVSLGNYRATVTMPTGCLYDNRVPSFRSSSTVVLIDGSTLNAGDLLNLSVEKINANSFYVYINDNTIGLTIHYS